MSTSTTIIAWCVAAAIHFAPPDRQPDWPGYAETNEETVERYAAICEDIAATVEGRKHPRTSAALLMAWSLGESGWARDVDEGSPGCYHGPGHASRCDAHNGVDRAASLWQIHAHRDRETGEQITTRMLFDDRSLAARIAMRGLDASWQACRHLKPADRFSGFGVGRCVENEQVRKRFALYQTIAAWRPTGAGEG